jgi:nucleoside-diphosphate-sugar epimerase
VQNNCSSNPSICEKVIAVTGATGLNGSAIVREAIARECKVICFIRKDTKRTNSIPNSNQCRIVPLDMSEYASANINEQADIFFHLAWNTERTDFDDVNKQLANVYWTLDAVRLAKKMNCKVFVGGGSQAEYGKLNGTAMPNTSMINPQSGYGIAKYAAGKFSRLLCSQLNIRHNWVRIFATFGMYDTNLIAKAINELKKSRRLLMSTKCEQMWDYLYSDDAAKAFLAVAEKGVDGKIYLLGSGKPRKLCEYLRALKDIVDPMGFLDFGDEKSYPHDPGYLCADISELTTDTGWKPEIMFEAGIQKIINA